MKRKTFFIILALVLVLLVVSPAFRAKPTLTAAEAKQIVSDWGQDIKDAAAEHGLPFDHLAGVVGTESKGKENAIGSAGEIGLTQVKPSTLQDINRRFGSNLSADDLYNGRTNIFAGAGYLHLQLERTGNLDDATRAYNQGMKGAQLSPLAGFGYLRTVKANSLFFT